MKLSFSTLACPLWNFAEVFSAAKDLGFDGIEIRGIGRQMYAPMIREFSPENRAYTIERFHSADLKIPVFTSAAYLYDGKNTESVRAEASDYIDLAAGMGVKYIRVLGDKDGAPDPALRIHEDVVLANYRKVCDMAADRDVTVLIETNGIFADSGRLADFMAKADRKNAAVLWDIHHTFRYFGETPEKTVSNLGGLIRHVHLKDSVMDHGRVVYRMMGYGDLPVKDAVTVLNDIGYDGFYSLEWVKRWAPDLTEAGIALPQFINYMKNILA